MSTTDTCSNCGKGEECSGDLKACTACNMVKYCNRDCQIAHRPQHKKACKKRASELHDEALFGQPPPPEECPICFLHLPLDREQTYFHSCCGEIICGGCEHTMITEELKKGKKRNEIGACPFCRTLYQYSGDEELAQVKRHTEKGVREAFFVLAGYYNDGVYGLQQDRTKANELFLKAGELGHGTSYYNLGVTYADGLGVAIDKKKAKHYYELAAMNGNASARCNLGLMEADNGNIQRAMKHFVIAVKAGHDGALEIVKKGFMDGYVTKEEYASTLRTYQKSQDEMKSETRDKAEAFLNED